jgi:hypothetical protein
MAPAGSCAWSSAGKNAIARIFTRYSGYQAGQFIVRTAAPTAVRMTNKTIRQSISLPAGVAAQVRSLAKTRRLSANRMLVELIEDGMEAQKRKQQQFFELAERFRGATDPDEAKRLGDELGRMVFGA